MSLALPDMFEKRQSIEPVRKSHVPPKSKSSSTESFTFQRIVVGVLAGVFLAIGVLLYIGGNPEFQALSGLLVRVGLLLGAGCLAWDQLLGLPPKLSLAGLVLGIGLLFLAASRPRLFPILFAAAVIGIFVNGAIRRFTGKLPKR